MQCRTQVTSVGAASIRISEANGVPVQVFCLPAGVPGFPRGAGSAPAAVDPCLESHLITGRVRSLIPAVGAYPPDCPFGRNLCVVAGMEAIRRGGAATVAGLACGMR
jgi:hypothetical protein